MKTNIPKIEKLTLEIVSNCYRNHDSKFDINRTKLSIISTEIIMQYSHTYDLEKLHSRKIIKIGDMFYSCTLKRQIGLIQLKQHDTRRSIKNKISLFKIFINNVYIK